MTPLRQLLARIPDLSALCKQPSKLVPFFALYLEQLSEGTVITPKSISDLFEEARIKPPVNISDTLRKSKYFVVVRGAGYRLSHEGLLKFSVLLLPDSTDKTLAKEPKENLVRNDDLAAQDAAKEASSGANRRSQAGVSRRDVLVIYGRDNRLRKALFEFLRAVGLNPLEFEEMVHRTDNPSPFTLEVLETAFRYVQACVVLFSPDESVTLRPALRTADESEIAEFQPRPNVLLEAGMAIALHPKRTILVRVGNVRSISDLDGKQYVRLNGSAESRHKLVGRLKLAECEVNNSGDDWLSAGEFEETKGVTA